MSVKPSPFRILIVGAGIGGLAAATRLAQIGHKVSVFERKSGLDEFGAGIQCPPNVMRILKAWDMTEEVEKYTSAPERILVRRYENGEIKGIIPTSTHCVLHRADLQRVLYDAATKAGARVYFRKTVSALDADKVTLTFEDGSVAAGNLIVGADGLRSFVRNEILQSTEIQLLLTDECLFRTMIPKAAIVSDREILGFFDQSTVDVWAGPNKHLVMYPVKQGDLLNLVWNDHGDGEVGSWNEPADLDDLRERFALFEPPVRRLLDYVQECSKWKVAELPPLSRWTAESGKVVLLGDAAHAMTPHAAQGAAQAIEDAAVLAQLLSKASFDEDFPQLMKVYETLRKPRVERIQEAARLNMVYWQLADGPEQKQRDIRLSESLQKKGETRGGQNGAGSEIQPDMHARFGEPRFQLWLHDTDVVREAASVLSLI